MKTKYYTKIIMVAEDGEMLPLNIDFVSEYPVTYGKVKEQAYNIASTYDIDRKFTKVLSYELVKQERLL